MADLLIRDVRVVPFRSRAVLGAAYALPGASRTDPAARRSALVDVARRRAEDAARGVDAGEPVDVLVRRGRVVAVGHALDAPGARVLEGDGAYAIPGLWDAHAHLDLEAARAGRLDLRATRGPEDVLELVRRAVDEVRAEGGTAGTADTADPAGAPGASGASVQGFGFRLSGWSRTPTVAELDAVSGDVPVALVSGDVHSGWLNSAALRVLGVRGADGPLSEDPWFSVLNRLDEVPGTADLRERGYRALVADLLSRGVCGVVDMTQPVSPADWPRRIAKWDLPLPRIRAAVYRDQLGTWIDEGVRAGDPLPGSPLDGAADALLTQGPLKVIADGSMGTRTAFTRDAYPAGLGVEHDHGVENLGPDELRDLMARATAAGYPLAVHAIGDACLDDVVAAFAATGARGRVEHAQLLREDPGALDALARLGVEVSVQPAHLLDDWPAVSRVWPGREERCYAFADMVGAGVLLHLGSDAPVAPLDPWLAMSVAVGRVVGGAVPAVWGPEQRLTPEEALAASVDGAGPVAVGSRADVVLCPDNPLAPAPDPAEAAARLAGCRPVSTVVGGHVALG